MTGGAAIAGGNPSPALLVDTASENRDTCRATGLLISGWHSSLWSTIAVSVTAAALLTSGSAMAEAAVARDYAQQMRLRPYGVGDRLIGGSGGKLFPADKFRRVRVLKKKRFRWNEEYRGWMTNRSFSAIPDQPGELHPLLPEGV